MAPLNRRALQKSLASLRRGVVSLAARVLLAALVAGLSAPAPLRAQVTIADEMELGRDVQMQIAKTGYLFSDPIINAYYQRVAAKVLGAAGPQPYPYHFSIIKSNSINAFAVPGGYIYMHTETIISLENEGELAAILAHEVAHITSRHFARRVEAAKSVSLLSVAGLLAAVLVGSQGGGSAASALGPALMIGSTGVSIQTMLAHSRSDESEADTKGRRYMTRAGYSPRDMYGAFKIMASKTYQVSRDIPSYLSTHPDITYRLSTTFQDYADAPPPPPDAEYQAIRDRLLALSGDSRRVSTVMSGRLSRDKNDASALHALGLLAAREQNYGQADKLMNQALALSPRNNEYLADLGDLAIKRRKPEEAKSFYERAERGGDQNPQVYLGLARAYETLKQRDKAAAYYDKAVSGSTPYPDALDFAGRFFGANGQLGKGHYYLAAYFASVGKLDQALFHYEKALKAPDIGALRQKAQRAESELRRLKDDQDGKKR